MKVMDGTEPLRLTWERHMSNAAGNRNAASKPVFTADPPAESMPFAGDVSGVLHIPHEMDLHIYVDLDPEQMEFRLYTSNTPDGFADVETLLRVPMAVGALGNDLLLQLGERSYTVAYIDKSDVGVPSESRLVDVTDGLPDPNERNDW